MSERITVEDAFKAMIIYLDRYYDRGKGADTLGDVLSAISQTIWDDGSPNDPAQWEDWLDAVKSVNRDDS
jgi:hypothetical protein